MSEGREDMFSFVLSTGADGLVVSNLVCLAACFEESVKRKEMYGKEITRRRILKDKKAQKEEEVAQAVTRIKNLNEKALLGDQESKKEKEEARIIKTLQVTQTKMASLNFRSTLLLGVVMIGILWFLNGHYSGTVVAKLPFVPLSLIQGLTHRNLPGDDFTVSSVGPCPFAPLA